MVIGGSLIALLLWRMKKTRPKLVERHRQRYELEHLDNDRHIDDVTAEVLEVQAERGRLGIPRYRVVTKVGQKHVYGLSAHTGHISGARRSHNLFSFI